MVKTEKSPGRRRTERSLAYRRQTNSQLADAKVPRVERRATSQRGRLPRPSRPEFRWASTIVASEWEIYRGAIAALRSDGVPFLLGGGFALATFTGRWRDTKDIDFYIKPEARRSAIAALKRAGFVDYFHFCPYDRKWIYRSIRSNVIVDLIWSMANQRARVDDLWFQRARSITIRGEKLGVVPKEEFVWCKLYIQQRDHCDWPDIFNVLYATGRDFDWRHLLERLGEDAPLLRAVLIVFRWLCPDRVRHLPAWIWQQLRHDGSRLAARTPRKDRIRLLDSRAWFAALLPQGQRLDV